MAPRRSIDTAFSMEWKTFQIEEIDAEGMAHGIDQFGKQMMLPINVRRAKGALPAVGDQWVIDKALGGRWSFAAVLNTVPPEVTGSRSQNAAVASALSVLEALGFITDATVPGSLPGGGGGVTDHGALTGLADDDHPQYLRQAEADALYEELGTASSAIIAHEGDPDPHGQYLSESEADALYEPEGQAAVAVSAHVGASDPHTQYAKESDLGTAAAASLDTDSTFAANSDAAVPSQKAVKTRLDQRAPVHRSPVLSTRRITSVGSQWTAATLGMTNLGDMLYAPIFLPAGTYNNLYVATTVAGNSTWRVGLMSHASGDPSRPGVVHTDAGVINMNATAGLLAAPSATGMVVPVDAWYWCVAKVETYTAQPTVVATGTGGAGWGNVFAGWPGDTTNFTRNFFGYSDTSPVSAGALATANAITGAAATGLDYTTQVPRFWIGT